MIIYYNYDSYVHCDNKLNWHYQSDNYTYANRSAIAGGIAVFLNSKSWTIDRANPDLGPFFKGDFTFLIFGKVERHEISGDDADDEDGGRDDADE